VSGLHLDDNLLLADKQGAFSITGFDDSGAYGVAGLDVLSVAGNVNLSRPFSIDALPMPSVNASNTRAGYCYNGATFASAWTQSVSVRNVRPAPNCNRRLESEVGSSVFVDCFILANSSSAAAAMQLAAHLNETLCVVGSSRVVFTNSSLTCPAWSTVATFGAAKLDVDAAFLGFWGCACPEGTYWGYANLSGLSDEALLLRDDSSLGEIETVLQSRACLPCPPSVDCSPLAVPEAPHALRGSVYPISAELGETARTRSRFPYVAGDASSSRVVSCLHPSVCNRAPFGLTTHWPDWIARVAAGDTTRPEFASYQCRQGHRVEALLCSACEAGYWMDGLLCERCPPGAAAWVVISALACTGLLAAYLWRHHRQHNGSAVDGDAAHSDSEKEESDNGGSAGDNQVSLILWLLQVSATLHVPAQVAAAGRGSAHDDRNAVAAVFPLLSFRPWGIECLTERWTFEASSWLLFALPWAVAVAGAWRASMRQTAAVLLDLLYLPLAQRAIEWFNTRRVLGEVCARVRAHIPPPYNRLPAHAEQCFLLWSPSTHCSSSVAAFAGLTFACFVAAPPLAASWLLWRHPRGSAVEFLLRPYRGGAWRALWVPPLHFGRKLWFAALVGGWTFTAGSEDDDVAALALTVFWSLLALLLLQVRRARVSAAHRSLTRRDARCLCVPTSSAATTSWRCSACWCFCSASLCPCCRAPRSAWTRWATPLYCCWCRVDLRRRQCAGTRAVAVGHRLRSSRPRPAAFRLATAALAPTSAESLRCTSTC
jgi:hypothetical protein